MKKIIAAGLVLILFGFSLWFFWHYRQVKITEIKVKEYSRAAYPEDPSGHSQFHHRYQNRKLRLVQKDKTHYDFVLYADDPAIAKITLKNIDLSLMAVSQPTWTRNDPHLEIIALTDREWNRQQVSFDRSSPELAISGGDGFEVENLSSVGLARNCLNAGLWEILLFTKEAGKKALYYQGWFDFPLGHYKNLVESNAGISYWKHFWRLEHWLDPEGTPVKLSKLRQVIKEYSVKSRFLASEKPALAGEQLRKQRTVDAENIRTYSDFYTGQPISFATFVPPGLYKHSKPWSNEYERLAKYNFATLRQIKPAAKPSRLLHELELNFISLDQKEHNKLIISGIDLRKIPQLPSNQYFKGLYMPMGIGVPPFYQSYADLQKSPPAQSPYFSLLLNQKNEWLNHHDIAVDGPVMHRDQNNPRILHLYLLSYERHTLIAHFRFFLPAELVKASK